MFCSVSNVEKSQLLVYHLHDKQYDQFRSVHQHFGSWNQNFCWRTERQTNLCRCLTTTPFHSLGYLFPQTNNKTQQLWIFLGKTLFHPTYVILVLHDQIRTASSKTTEIRDIYHHQSSPSVWCTGPITDQVFTRQGDLFTFLTCFLFRSPTYVSS